MATRFFKGDAQAVAKVMSATPATVTVGNIFTLTINNKSVSFTATVATVANVTAGLAAALQASTEPEFTMITWADATTKVTGTSKTAGRDFLFTTTATQGSGSAGMTLTTATTTANDGPNVWSAANFVDTTGATGLPGSAVGDIVYVDRSPSSIKWGLDQSAIANTITRLEFNSGWYGERVGLPLDNPDGYREYLDTSLKIKATEIIINCPSGGQINLDVGSTAASTVRIINNGNIRDTGLRAVNLTGDNASHTVYGSGISLGLHLFPNQSGQIPTVNVDGNSDVLIKSMTGAANNWLFGGSTQVTIIDSNANNLVFADNAQATIICPGKTHVSYKVDGSAVVDIRGLTQCTTLTLKAAGELIASNADTGIALPTINMVSGSKLRDKQRRVTFTTINLKDCGIEDVTLDVGKALTLAITAA